jgi:hypothetical protein
MDIMDAGVWVAKWEAEVPKLQTVLWGPLQAKEMGFVGWDWQDGGETGFIAHQPHSRLPAGFATSTLIVQNRMKKAYLSVYLGGYPADVKASQRRLDQEKVVGQAQMFLTRLAKKPVKFQFMGEMTLVDNVNDVVVESPANARVAASDASGDSGEAAVISERSGVWEI